MKVANLIITYTNPQLTERMINRLGCEYFDYYIHVDKKKNIEDYRHLTKYPNVFLVKKRIDVRWAGYNTTRAVFSCVKEALASGREYQYLNLLSGQDYPIKPPERIIAFLKENLGKQYIEYSDINEDWVEAQIRLRRYDLANFNIPGKHLLQRIVNKLLPDRKVPFGMKPYGRGMFWMLTPERAAYVVNYVESSKKLSRFFAFTWGGDEIVFQTLLLNSPYKNEVVNNDYRYIDWSEAGSGHPKTLGFEDFEKMKNSTDLFGRKFIADGEGELFDALDAL
ncbi:beta-1,6-N-acetylglucosaminyltransferase [Mucilaginibacter sp.]